MKILALSDEKVKYFYDFYQPGRLKGYDLIISCGDLPKKYLEFIVTMASCPVLYVHGNHDDHLLSDPPEGCDCIDGKLYIYKGLRILGLGGSYRYNNGVNMYTENEMERRIWKLAPKLWWNKGVDLIVTHAPIKDVSDLDNISHQGFECFKGLIEKYEPQYLIHGHVHRNYGAHIPQMRTFGKTKILNAYEYCEFEIENKTL